MSWKEFFKPSWLKGGVIGGVVLVAGPLIGIIPWVVTFILSGFPSAGPTSGLIFFGLSISSIFL